MESEKGTQQMQEAVDFTFDELVEELATVVDRLASLERSKWMLEKRIVHLMMDRGATVAKTETHEVEIRGSVTYDVSILARLREITDPEDLERIYYPEHEEVVRRPEKWNMTSGRKLAKFSHEHAAIIEDAKIYGNPKVSLRLRE